MAMKPQYFNAEKRQKALKWINDKWLESNQKCDICSENEWGISDHIVAPFGKEAHYRVGVSSYPQFMVICANCGNTKYFNAVLAGIEKDDVKNSPKIEPKKGECVKPQPTRGSLIDRFIATIRKFRIVD